MLTLFENVTNKLTDHEKENAVPLLMDIIGGRVTPEKAVKNKDLVKWLASNGIKTTEIRIRMMINYIRNTNMLPCLIGSGKGYFVTDDPRIVDDQVESIMGRVNSMLGVVQSLKAQKENLIIQKKYA